VATFTYKARTRQGEILQDQMEADDTMSVASQLRQQGLLVIDVKEQGVAQKDILEPFKRVKLGDLVVFSRQFATMINAGLPIVRALYVLSEQTGNPKLQEVVTAVRNDVEAGLALSEALEKHPKVFNRLYVEMVRAGETGGILDGVLLLIADQLEGDQELRRKVKSAMTYPTIVLFLAILAASFMLIFIVPVFARMFEDLGSTLPLPTRIAMGLSDILTSIWGVFVYATMIGSVFGFLRWKNTENGRRIWGRITLRIPARIGDVIHKVALARFARTLGTLSAAGVPILQAFEITATSSGNRVIENALLKTRDAVRQGMPIYKPLEDEPVFPPMVTRMIAVGEETGDVDGMLTKIAEFYESEVDATVKALTSIVEPLMIVVVGGIVGHHHDDGPHSTNTPPVSSTLPSRSARALRLMPLYCAALSSGVMSSPAPLLTLASSPST
jgi:type IV pilus assembly protein PilC